MSRKILTERVLSGISYRQSDIGNIEAKHDDGLPSLVNMRSLSSPNKPGYRGPNPPTHPRDSIQPIHYLPLLKVAVEVTVDGTIASTKLTQRLINKSEYDIREARYTFPLYDGAAVTNFKCSVGDDLVLVGKVERREAARETYKAAVERKQAAALLEEHTPEIFETMIGTIPPMTEVEIEIKYVNEVEAVLFNGGKEGLEVIIPTSIAPRYGETASRGCDVNSAASVTPQRNALDILIKINNDGSINGVTPSHNSRVNLNVPIEDEVVDSFEFPATEQDEPVHTAKYTQIHVKHTTHTTTMEEDFTVAFETSHDRPLRSRAVLSPTNIHGHAALLVNVKPGEFFQDAAGSETFNGEIIFVLDQSDSMGWNYPNTYIRTKMSTLRDAVCESLNSLPTACAFNILSFGSGHRFLWHTGSQPYTEKNRQAAVKYANNVQADMGGTEMLAAVEAAVASRQTGRSSTQIIIITDGEVEESHVLEFVWKTRQEYGEQIRFFALGIGTQVPHRLIERVGEFGGGYGEVIDINRHAQWGDRLKRMLTAGIMPPSWEFEVDLGQGFERKSLEVYRLRDLDAEELGQQPPVPYIQAPYPAPAMHPFTYRSIFFLLELGTRPAPQRVTLRSVTPGTRLIHELHVTSTWTDKASILHLATKAVVQGLAAQAQASEAVWSRSIAECVAGNAERLGIMYSITSRWTSFVAVDEDRREVREVEFYKTHLVQAEIGELLCLPIPNFPHKNFQHQGEDQILKTGASSTFGRFNTLRSASIRNRGPSGNESPRYKARSSYDTACAMKPRLIKEDFGEGGSIIQDTYPPLKTSDGVISHERFQEWKESKLSRILWVLTNASHGESSIATCLINHFRHTAETETMYHFFSRNDLTNKTHVADNFHRLLHRSIQRKPVPHSNNFRRFLHRFIKQKPVRHSDKALERLDALEKTYRFPVDEALIGVAEEEGASNIVCLFNILDENVGLLRVKFIQALYELCSKTWNLGVKFLVISQDDDRSADRLQSADVLAIRVDEKSPSTASNTSDGSTESSEQEIETSESKKRGLQGVCHGKSQDPSGSNNTQHIDRIWQRNDLL
ncbi:hypothetical protein QQS21_005962 [Conoideocrella luteorostrata]|uniref:von Willebrand factor type A domain-containing protein n=1 Tax=Conoideocrella luteorostrata TaxID=1105319 RepID=A0AAJ0CNF6_9HYPO|nr:hypothetical protein QQS21_005962 [Conoideocrella luteorostrata]